MSGPLRTDKNIVAYIPFAGANLNIERARDGNRRKQQPNE